MDRRRRAARTVALMSLFTMADTQTDVPIASFDGDGSDLISLIVGIEPIQDLHGYDNPWPAGGGKNKLNVPQSVSLSGAGFLVPSNTGINLPAGTYTLSFSASSVASGARFQIILSFGSTDVFSRADSIIASTSITFTTEQDADTIRIFCNNSNACVYTNAMIESGSTATSFAPYSNICPISGWTGANIHVSPTTDAEDGETYSITFPTSAGTVYGGTLDVTTGKLTVNRAMVDLGSLNWTKTNTSGGNWWFSTNKSDAKRPASNHDYANVLCSQYEKRTPNQLWGGNVGVGINYSSSYIVVVDSNYSDATAFKTAMNGVQLCYELATPIVYDLTPTQVTTLIGTNNIWADTGDIKYIEYNI